tara:strand:+ start:1100 stop:1888 length:789 start_codon:yes stop_codon:yes gene_type:complete
MIKKITSLENKHIKHVIKLIKKSKLRKKTKTFVVEGYRELKMAHKNGYEIIKIFCDSNIVNLNDVSYNFKSNIIEVNSAIYSKISLRKSTEGLVALVREKNKRIYINRTKINLAVVIDGVEKPGNLGAILRSCDASDVDLIILTNQKCDLFNPNVIRSSIGSVFSQNIFQLECSEAFDILKKYNFSIYSTSLNDSVCYHSIKYKNSCAIIFGSENLGISEFWKNKSDKLIKIPMLGRIDSLNVSVSAGIILSEVNRQNKFSR